MVDYKGKIGIYKAKNQAKYLGEPTVEYHQQCLKTGDFKGIFTKGKDEGSKFRKVKIHLAKFRKVVLHGAKWPNFAP